MFLQATKTATALKKFSRNKNIFIWAIDSSKSVQGASVFALN